MQVRKANGKRLLAIERKQLRKKIIESIQLTLNIIHYYLDYYVLNRLRQHDIQNDLGASFTAITRIKDRIIKRADPKGESKLVDEITWMLQFDGTDFGTHLPKIHRYSLEQGQVYYEMKYYNYPNLRRIILSKMNAPFFIRLRLRYLLEIMRNYLWIPEHSAPCPDDFVHREHLDKYRQRIDMLLDSAPWFRTFTQSRTLEINGKSYLNASYVMQAVLDAPAILASLRPERLYWSHGDVHTNNILCGIRWSNMILIDCRGKSNSGTVHFDVAYDIAKLFHDFGSLYSLIERHSYSLFHTPGTGTGMTDPVPRLEFRFLDTEAAESFREYYHFLRDLIAQDCTEFGNLIERADFVEAMLYLTMIPMHLKRKDEGIACYLTGVQRLNEWLATYHPTTWQELQAGHDHP